MRTGFGVFYVVGSGGESEDMQTRQMCLKSPIVCLDPVCPLLTPPPPLCVCCSIYAPFIDCAQPPWMCAL